MQLQDQTNQSRYEMTSSMLRNNAKMHQTASTGFRTTRNSSFRLRRTSSFTNANVKSKLDVFEGVLQSLAEEIGIMKNDSQESRKFCQAITQDLPSNLSNKNASLKQKIKDMKANMQAVKGKQKQRVQAIRNRCSELYDKNVEIKDRFNGLRFRIEEMERIMGYYGGHQKYKS